jgi:hypothetical protein
VTSAEQTIKLDNALLAIRVTTSVKELAFSLLPIPVHSLMLDAKFGIGQPMLVVNAHNSGFQFKVFALQFLLFVNLLMLFQGFVYLAILAMILVKVLVFTPVLTQLLQVIQDARLGIKEYAKNALKIGHSMRMEFVLLFLIYVKQAKDFLAQAALTVMFSSTDHASSHP